MQIQARIVNQLQSELPTRLLFECATIAELALAMLQFRLEQSTPVEITELLSGLLRRQNHLMNLYTAPEHWAKVANAYSQLESPLRPCAEDIVIMERLINKAASYSDYSDNPIGPPKPNALLLGVTPAIATMAWPSNTNLLAIDSSEEACYARYGPGIELVHGRLDLGNWLSLPLEDASCSIVVGDGSFNCLEFPNGVEQLAASVARVLRDDGILVLRLFTQPARPQKPERVWQALITGKLHTFDGFRFLLMTSLVDAHYNVRVSDVWEYWLDAKLDQQAILDINGWSAKRFETIAYYQNSSVVYSFPTLPAAEQLLAHYFEKLDMAIPSYQVGDCCPILLLRKRKSRMHLNPTAV